MFSLILAEEGASLEGQQTTKKILHIGGDDWRSFVQYFSGLDSFLSQGICAFIIISMSNVL